MCSLPPHSVVSGEAKTENQEDPVLVESSGYETEAACNLESGLAHGPLHKDIHVALNLLT